MWEGEFDCCDDLAANSIGGPDFKVFPVYCQSEFQGFPALHTLCIVECC